MAYKVIIARVARRDILDAADFIHVNRSLERALNWKRDLIQAIRSLDKMPNRCPMADEALDVGMAIRELHYRSHRIIFRVEDEMRTVEVLRVYHLSRSPLTFEDLIME